MFTTVSAVLVHEYVLALELALTIAEALLTHQTDGVSSIFGFSSHTLSRDHPRPNPDVLFCGFQPNVFAPFYHPSYILFHPRYSKLLYPSFSSSPCGGQLTYGHAATLVLLFVQSQYLSCHDGVTCPSSHALRLRWLCCQLNGWLDRPVSHTAVELG